MTLPLDEKGLEAAEAAWHQTDMGLRCKLSDAIRAYLSTTPAPDGLERHASMIDFNGKGLPCGTTMVPVGDGGWVRADQAQSALAAVSKERDEAQDANASLSRLVDELDPKFSGRRVLARAETAEAEVKRLTEANGALDGSLNILSEMHAAEQGRAEAAEARIKALEEALGNMRCPRPCNHRPDEFDAKDCVAAGECGCGAAILSGGLNAPS